MPVTMRFEGGQELAHTLNKLSARMSKRVVREALEAGGEPIRRQMSVLAPRRAPAPDIADHIVMSPARADGVIDNAMVTAVAIGPARGFRHGWYQEFGTVHHGAQPFVRPAFDAGWQPALGVIAAAFWTALASLGVSRTVAAPSRPSAPGGGDVL